jgi:hypothetical protein
MNPLEILKDRLKVKPTLAERELVEVVVGPSPKFVPNLEVTSKL